MWYRFCAFGILAVMTAPWLDTIPAVSLQTIGGRQGTPARVPDTLEEFVARADALVHGHVVASKLTFVPPPPGDDGDALVVRKHTVRVIQVLKGEGIIDKRPLIQVAQIGGTLDVHGREISTPYDQPIKILTKGDEVILALIDWPRAGAFTIRWAAAGIFPVKDGQVIPRAEATRLPQFAGQNSMSLFEFIAAVRR